MSATGSSCISGFNNTVATCFADPVSVGCVSGLCGDACRSNSASWRGAKLVQVQQLPVRWRQPWQR
jgi:hypothetical protein